MPLNWKALSDRHMPERPRPAVATESCPSGGALGDRLSLRWDK